MLSGDALSAGYLTKSTRKLEHSSLIGAMILDFELLKSLSSCSQSTLLLCEPKGNESQCMLIQCEQELIYFIKT